MAAGVAFGAVLWNVSPPAALHESSWHFLVGLAVAILLWIFEVFDDYIVALSLVFLWVSVERLPTDIALSGFASSEWFFALSALGMAAAITKVGLMRGSPSTC